MLIATPAPTHAGLIAAAAAAGKHILVEKPIAYSLAEAREAIAAVARSASIAWSPTIGVTTTIA